MKKNTKVSWQVLIPGATTQPPRGRGHTIAVAENAKLHAAITKLIGEAQSQIKEKIDAATGDDLVALARTVLGVPQLSNVPAAGDPGGAAAGGGAAPAAAVRVPGGA